MVDQQMLCIVTPLGSVSPRTVAERLSAASTLLDDLFARHGAIHYATLALLPPSAEGTPEPSGASLALMLAVDADLPPGDALRRLVALGQPTLSTVYEGTVDTGDADTLLAALVQKEHLHLATGGYVGARDRSVSQIRAEQGLVSHVRDGVLTALASPSPDDARTLAEALSTQVLADPDFAWAARPSPRSRWRDGVTPAPVRLAATAGYGVFFALATVALGILALGGFLNQLAVAFFDASFIGLDSDHTFMSVLGQGGALGMWLRGLTLAMVLLTLLAALVARIEGLQVMAFELVLVVSVLVTVLLALAPVAAMGMHAATQTTVLAEMRFALTHIGIGFCVFLALAALVVMLAAACTAGLLLTPSASSTARLVATTLACVLAGFVAVHATLRLVLTIAEAFGSEGASALLGSGGRPWYLGLVFDRIAIVVIAVAVAVAVLLYLVAQYLKSAWSRLSVPLNAPRPDREGVPYDRLHQTAPAIDECEARLVGRTAFMVSVTEMRRPYWLHATAARFFLWLVGSLGWHYYSEGRLGSVASIQFAHWHVIDRGRRMLFCANFDGDFGGYLDDFITGQVPLINVIWRWTCLGVRPAMALGGPTRDAPATRTRLFPRTRLGLFAGCRSEQQFKAYARDSMLPFQYRYAAYDRSLGQILRATRFRNALSAPRGLVSDDVLLRTLDS